MNRLFSLFLSLHLMLSPVAFAQAEGDEFKNNISASNKGGDLTFHANQILALGIGLVGASILSGCKSGPSVYSLYPFMAAGLGYIGSEISGGKAHSDFLNQSAEKMKIIEEKIKEKGVQKASLETALENERNNLKFIKKKLTWMAAITALFLTAMGTAIVEKVVHETAKRTAQATKISAQAACKATATACTASCMVYACAACVASFLICNNTAEATYQATLKALVVANQTFCTPGTSLIKSKLLATLVVGAYSNYALKAGGEGQISKIGGVALSLLPMLSLVNIQIDVYDKVRNTLLGNERKRIVTFAAFSAVAGLVTTGLNKKKKVVEENVAKLEKVLKNFKEQTETDNTTLAEGGDYNTDGDDIKNSGIKNGKLKALPDGIAARKFCFSASADNYSEASCSNSLQLRKPAFNFQGMNPTLVAANNTAADLGKYVAEGNTDQAEIAVGNLGSMATRLKTETDDLQKKLNQDLIKNGEKPITDQEIQSQVSQIENDLKSAADSKGIDLAKLNGGDGAESSTPADVVASVAPIAPEPESINLDVGAATDSTVIEELPSDAAGTTATLDESLDQYVTNEQDISKKSDVSIFKQVSNRYLLNYTRIFREKKKIEEPTSAPAVTP